MSGLPHQQFRERDALLLGLVREHRSGDHVADRIDARNVGRVMRVHLHATALVQRHARRLQTNPIIERPPADRDQHHLGLQFLRRSALGRLHGQRHAVLGLGRAGHLGRQLELDPELAEHALESAADLAVHAGTRRSRNSTTVTSAPSRRHTLPSSRPI